jgi:thiamine biosynthesis lipoprotein
MNGTTIGASKNTDVGKRGRRQNNKEEYQISAVQCKRNLITTNFCAWVLIVFCWGCQPDIHTIQETRVLMDTLVSISVYTANPQDTPSIQRAIAAAFAEMARLDSLMSSYRRDSEVAAINHAGAAGGEISVSADVDTVLRVAQSVAHLSQGAFDVTIGPVLRLWGFGTDSVDLPSPEKITARLPLVNYHNLEMNREREDSHLGFRKMRVRFREPGMAIDLGGIAKGYAVDHGLEVLVRAGYQDALVAAGGDLRAAASSLTAGRRYIWIRHPRPKNSTSVSDGKTASASETFWGRFRLDRGAVSTSGDYERFFEKDSIRYHHIIDPHTGHPAPRVVSATVVASNSTLADALSTALFVLGPEQGIALADSLPEVEGLIIYPKDGQLQWRATKALADKMEIFE